MRAVEVLAVTSEIYPLVKTGGLADVTGALPGALAPHGIAVTTLIPGYPAVMAALETPRVAHAYADLLGAPARLLKGTAAGLSLLVLDAPTLFDRPGGPYGDERGIDWPDNGRRFAALARAGADIGLDCVHGFRPDIVHGHDWQAGLTAGLPPLCPRAPDPEP